MIYTQLNAYGFEGPWAHRHGFEQLAQACTGAAAIQGGGIDTPALVPAYMNDYLTGYLAALGTMAARLKQAEEGGAWLVNISLSQTCMFIMNYPHQDVSSVKSSELDELEPWLIDQDSEMGILTRLKPPIVYSETPMYARCPATPVGANLAQWHDNPETKIIIPYRPTECFDKIETIGDMRLK